ncbi:MAG: DNA polymerase III subunit alpha, partial [Firmicutes bacterium]|nr:DNA polymerase III subunit alpha [Bacillota bacterium]
IQTNKKVDDVDRMRYEGGQYYLKSPEEMAQLFPYALQALENTEKIAQRCQLEFKFHELKLPQYDVPAGYDAKSYLRMLCEKGWKERYPEETPQLRERLEYELSVIESMGYVDYFLIVWDFINYAKSQRIMVGPGRGSAAGSVVAYCLRITDIEPVKYSLVFERFLNPERVSMPDIDVDFCYRHRQDVIDYVTRKYGEDRVTQIITFGTMAARLVLRDVGRALDMPYGDVDKIAKMIPRDLGMTIQKALEVNPELSELYKTDETVKKLIDTSLRLEGLPRHSSTHAAGVVISKRPVMDYVPLATNDGAPVTQFTMTTIEELGLLKMDFLGLRTLTVIQDALDLVEKQYGKKIKSDEIPMDDPEVFQMISAGKTVGVFQLESAGMTSFMKELRPESMEDIIAGISLYRPGPMDFIPKYIEGKRNAETVQYTSPYLEPILKPTYGCIVYQEQVMQIVRELAGYTMGRADLVRRAMSKKKADVMARERQFFIYGNEEEGVPGCVSKGVTVAQAEKIFDEMTDFAKYAFNKAHAACYAVVAIQTAWLKVHYPVEFMAALLTSVIDHPGKVAGYIQSLKAMNIELTSPDINEGYTGFSVSSDHRIRYGLSSIKGVGQAIVDRIVAEREKNGRFRSLNDFCQRMQGADMNKKVLENLIKAGAFDSLGGSRKDYLETCNAALAAAVQWYKNQLSGQMDLFGFSDDDEDADVGDNLPNSGEYNQEQKLALEKEVLGIYLTGHPMQEYEESWRKTISRSAGDFRWDEEDGQCGVIDGETATIGGVIMKLQTKITKSSKMMAFVTLEDLYGSVEVLLFPNVYEQARQYLVNDAKIFIRGRVSVGDEEDAKMIAQAVVPFGQEAALGAMEQQVYRKMYNGRGQNVSPVAEAAVNKAAANEFKDNTKVLWLRFAGASDWQQKQGQILNLLSQYPGPYDLYLYLTAEKQRLKAPEKYRISKSTELFRQLERILGTGSVVWR